MPFLALLSRRRIALVVAAICALIAAFQTGKGAQRSEHRAEAAEARLENRTTFDEAESNVENTSGDDLGGELDRVFGGSAD